MLLQAGALPNARGMVCAVHAPSRHMMAFESYLRYIYVDLRLKESGILGCMQGGETPLHDASVNEHVDIARVLVKYGADIHQKNDKGESPLDLCELPELQEILLGHVCRPAVMPV